MTAAEDERRIRFERLFEETHADMLAYALRRAPSPEDAADVLGETYLIAWRKLDSLPPGGQARLWLFGVARNVLRRGASRGRAVDALVERLAHELRGALSTMDVGEGERSPELWAALKALPEPQREVILLAAWEELSPRQIAAVTGAPVNLVRVRLHRARVRLKRELAGRAEDERTRTAPAVVHGNRPSVESAPRSSWR